MKQKSNALISGFGLENVGMWAQISGSGNSGSEYSLAVRVRSGTQKPFSGHLWRQPTSTSGEADRKSLAYGNE